VVHPRCRPAASTREDTDDIANAVLKLYENRATLVA